MRRINGIDGTGRYYVVDESSGLALPSVTTILGKMSEKKGLEEWKKRMGDEKAAQVSRFSANRGTFMHLMHEKTLDLRFNQGLKEGAIKQAYAEALEETKDMTTEEQECGRRLFFNFYSTDFYSRISRVALQESPVWSSIGGGYAGTLDLLVEDDFGNIKLIDFKSSKKPKKREWIRNYEMQAAAYSVACNERMGIFPKSAEIWISCETGEVQEFVMSRGQLMDAFKEFHGLVKEYHKKFQSPTPTSAT